MLIEGGGTMAYVNVPGNRASSPAKSKLADLNSSYFWWVFSSLFFVFCLPALLMIFLELSGLNLVGNSVLVSMTLFLNDQKISYLTEYGSHFLLPFCALATLSNASSVENRRKGFKLFFVFLALLLVCILFYALLWILKSDLDEIVGFPTGRPDVSVTAFAVCLPIWQTYIKFTVLNVCTLLGISTTQ